MEKEQFEQMVNQIYPGLTHFVRDANLNRNCTDKYEVGNIIYEKGFVDTTCKIGKLNKTVRYSIFSNQAVDLNSLVDDENKNNWGLCLINNSSTFKILDLYEFNDKLLITLLHIPSEYSDLIKQVHSNLDDEIIKASRKRFEESFNDEIYDELDEEWYKRIEFPLGMSNDGVLFQKPE